MRATLITAKGSEPMNFRTIRLGVLSLAAAACLAIGGSSAAPAQTPLVMKLAAERSTTASTNG